MCNVDMSHGKQVPEFDDYTYMCVRVHTNYCQPDKTTATKLNLQ